MFDWPFSFDASNSDLNRPICFTVKKIGVFLSFINIRGICMLYFACKLFQNALPLINKIQFIIALNSCLDAVLLIPKHLKFHSNYFRVK